jgi:hypothetical protein
MREFFKTHRVFVAILGLGLFAFSARNATDPDLWWHLRTGQLILQNHAVFHTDPYSFTRGGQPWINHEWLSDLFMYGLYRTGGKDALIVAFAGIAAGAFLLLFAHCPGKPYLAGAVTVWGALASAPSLGIRPQIISLLFVSFFLWLLERPPEKVALLWWTVPLTVLWVNLHAGFALGIALIALFLLGDLIAAGSEAWPTVKPRVWRLSLVLAGCLAVVPLNPYGTRMYWYPWETLSSHAIARYIQEWASSDFHQAMYLPFLLLVLALMAATAISPLRLKARELLLLTAMLYEGLHSVRHIPIFALVAAPILASLIQATCEQHAIYLRPVESSPRSAKLLLNAVLLASFAVFPVLRFRFIFQRQTIEEAREFPAQAVVFLLQNKPAGPLLNSYNWGGYLIWKLYPQYRVFVDGRTDLYDDGFLDDMASIYFAQGEWQRRFEPWQIQTVLLPPDAPLATILRSRAGWKMVYSDSKAIILTRSF